MSWWKWLGIAGMVGFVGVAGVAVRRSNREWADVDDATLRQHLHARLGET